MAEKPEPAAQGSEKVPLAQVVLDNIFLLLVLGLAVPFIFYTVWGLLEIASLPLAPPLGK